MSEQLKRKNNDVSDDNPSPTKKRKIIIDSNHSLFDVESHISWDFEKFDNQLKTMKMNYNFSNIVLNNLVDTNQISWINNDTYNEIKKYTKELDSLKQINHKKYIQLYHNMLPKCYLLSQNIKDIKIENYKLKKKIEIYNKIYNNNDNNVRLNKNSKHNKLIQKKT